MEIGGGHLMQRFDAEEPPDIVIQIDRCVLAPDGATSQWCRWLKATDVMPPTSGDAAICEPAGARFIDAMQSGVSRVLISENNALLANSQQSMEELYYLQHHSETTQLNRRRTHTVDQNQMWTMNPYSVLSMNEWTIQTSILWQLAYSARQHAIKQD